MTNNARPDEVSQALRRAALARAHSTSLATTRAISDVARAAAERREALVNCIRLGMTQRDIAKYLGISYQAVRKAIEREDRWKT